MKLKRRQKGLREVYARAEEVRERAEWERQFREHMDRRQAERKAVLTGVAEAVKRAPVTVPVRAPEKAAAIIGFAERWPIREDGETDAAYDARFFDYMARREEYDRVIAERCAESPEAANALGKAFTGMTPGKGLRDGNCNRTACQMPLAGKPQWTLPSYGHGGTDGKYHYCNDCAALFYEDDVRCGVPFRCDPA